MKKVSLALIGGLLLTGSVLAHSNAETDPTENFKTQVKELLSGYALDFEEDLTATVLFTINSDNEFVVLSVETSDEFLEYYVKSRLNYQKVDSEQALRGRRYTIPVKIRS